jgi:hypothetical protein
MNTANLAVLGPAENLPMPTSETGAMISMFERLVRDPSVPMDRIERAMDMIRELRREQAEEAFNDAMSDTQKELTPIARDSFNPQTRSKYASYHATDKAIRPIYTKHGLRVSFNEGAEGAPEGHIRVLAIVTKGRHTERYHYDSPVITQGMAGKTMMTLTHARASAVTYAKRYLVGMIFNLSTGEDDDGNRASDPSGTITDDQIRQIETLMTETNTATERFCGYMKVERIEDIPAKQFQRAIDALNAKKGKA